MRSMVVTKGEGCKAPYGMDLTIYILCGCLGF